MAIQEDLQNNDNRSVRVHDVGALLDVARGDVAGQELVQKFGSIVATSAQTNWKVVSTSTDYPTPLSAVSLEILSDDNVNDFHPDNSASKMRSS